MLDKYKKMGEILAAARREQQKSLKEASVITKLKEAYLEAVEAGEPDKLPSEPYFSLFARSYSQYLGLDPAILDEIEENERGGVGIAELTDASDRKDTDISEADSSRQAKKFGRNLIYLILIATVLFAALITFDRWFISAPEESGKENTETVHRKDDQGEKSIADKEPRIPYSPYQPPENLELMVSARQDVWMVVIRDGDTVLNRQLAAGDTRRWEAKYRFVLTIGISTAIDLTLNGVRLPPLTSQARTISGLEINQVNYKKFLPEGNINDPQASTSPIPAAAVNPDTKLNPMTSDPAIAGQSESSRQTGGEGEKDGD
jgi:hypothetical protein